VLEHWVAAFGVAVAIALIVTPLLSRGTLPTARRARVRLVTGAAPAIATLAGSVVVLADLDTELAVGLVAAAWLWWAGHLAELGHLPPPVERATLLVTAAVLTASGLRLEVTGVEWADVAVTVLVIWCALSAFRSAQSRDGILLGLFATIAAGAGLIGGLAGQVAVAGVAAAVVGACLGFVVYLTPPAVARLRAGGAGFLGCVVVVLALDARPDLAAPQAAVVPLLLLALPLSDSLLFALARLRSRRADRIEAGLVGRWRALGMSRRLLTIALPVMQLALGCIAALIARTMVSPARGAALAGVLLALIVVPALFAQHSGAGKRWPRRVFAAAFLLIAGALLATVPAAVALWRARDNASAAASAIREGLAAARHGDTESATAKFDLAAGEFTEARRILAEPLASAGLYMPVIGPNLDAGRQLTEIGASLSRTGERLTTTATTQNLRIVNATIDVNEVRRLEPEITGTTAELETALRRVENLDRDFLVPQVDHAVGELEGALRRSIRDGRTATLATQLLPAVLGSEGERRYILALQNPAEARATGGIFGNWAEITALNGRLDLVERGKSDALSAPSGVVRALHAPGDYKTRYARFDPQGIWQNVNLSPDLPTVGTVALDAWRQSGRQPASGVIVADPIGLAAVLTLTGPVEVKGWDGPITAQNVVDVTMRRAYQVFANDEEARDDFMGNVTQATWDALRERDLGGPSNVLITLGKASRGGHLMVWFADPREERLARRARADGGVRRTTSDLLNVISQNAAANKLDIYLRRNVTYNAQLTPTGGDRVALIGNVTVGLRNDAPTTGLTQYVAGPNAQGLSAGENRTYLSVYTPLSLVSTPVDPASSPTESGRELGSWVYSRYVQLAPGGSTQLPLKVRGDEQLARGGWYELALMHQPQLEPTPTHVKLTLADGWRFVDAQGFRLGRSGRTATLDRAVDRPEQLRVRVVRDRGSGLWGRLQRGAGPA
jgi:UDP-N-acetylmuramyl pentapeptide phosphotransferase/UDP-N-acetylglucosamine-1-phosphate transferase